MNGHTPERATKSIPAKVGFSDKNDENYFSDSDEGCINIGPDRGESSQEEDYKRR